MATCSSLAIRAVQLAQGVGRADAGACAASRRERGQDRRLQALRPHLAAHVDASPAALLFTGAKGAPLRSSNFLRAVKWEEAGQGKRRKKKRDEGDEGDDGSAGSWPGCRSGP